MTGGIHDVDVVILVFESGVLGLDGNALLAFEVHRIHDALLGGLRLIGAKSARLFEQAIDEGRLAMVNMGDNGDISDMLHNGLNRAA